MAIEYERYAELRDERKITDYRVSKETGISTVTFSKWKQGAYVPKIDKLQKIADYLKVPLSAITGEKDLITDPNAELLARIAFDKNMLNYVEKLYALSEKKRNHIFEMIDMLGDDDE